MKFAFLIHPLTDDTKGLMQLDPGAVLLDNWGNNILQFCLDLHGATEALKKVSAANIVPEPRMVDELVDLASPAGARADGRLYEIPMDARSIVEDPGQAIKYMEQATDRAAEWGARIVGLGSMTGIVGGQGEHLAERGPLPVTTGNSLTVYAALQSLLIACAETDIDLRRETVAVIGIPGSIAAAAARWFAPRCARVVLVGRRPSPRASRLAAELSAEFVLEIPLALSRARVVVSATSTGDCIDSGLLLPGSVVIDVGVPTDVTRPKDRRDDVLLLSGGLARVPDTMPRDSMFLGFYQGVVPCCLGETIVLALEGRAESFSLGRDLCLDRIEEIGGLARRHGFDFSQLFSFGQQLEPSALARFRKAAVRRRLDYRRDPAKNGAHTNGTSHPKTPLSPPAGSTNARVADRASQLYERYINPVLVRLGHKNGFIKTFVRGLGNEVWDAEGKVYLDFVAGFGSLNLGHNHPAVVRAVRAALDEQAPGFTPSAINPLAAALAEQLVALAPPGLEMVFFANSGTEAIEAGLKLARAVTQRPGLLYCERSFHGKSLGALSVTGNGTYQRPFGPLLPECQAIPFGDALAVERALHTRRFAAFVVEPIQGEGGMNVPPAGYLRAIHGLCRATDTLMIVDEVQTGLGRTGTLFAVDEEGVEPDVLTLAKSLGGGLVPLGAMLCRRDLWMKAYGSAQTFALHTSTFGGGSLACSAGLAALRVLHDEDLCANARARGEQLQQALQDLAGRCDLVRGVRGRGLMLGLEFHPMPDTMVAHFKGMDPSGSTALLVPNLDELIHSIPGLYAMQILLQVHGIYTQVTRSNPRVLRIQPPLTITEEQVRRFLEALESTCHELQSLNQMVDSIIRKSIGTHRVNSSSSVAKENRPQQNVQRA
jgi:acetylornithine/succinyldiaminopimelate/putrescine aminotransferase/predicted amino acid dehydrogenase